MCRQKPQSVGKRAYRNGIDECWKAAWVGESPSPVHLASTAVLSEHELESRQRTPPTPVACGEKNGTEKAAWFSPYNFLQQPDCQTLMNLG
jgi:hypothetical protein